MADLKDSLVTPDPPWGRVPWAGPLRLAPIDAPSIGKYSIRYVDWGIYVIKGHH